MVPVCPQENCSADNLAPWEPGTRGMERPPGAVSSPASCRGQPLGLQGLAPGSAVPVALPASRSPPWGRSEFPRSLAAPDGGEVLSKPWTNRLQPKSPSRRREHFPLAPSSVPSLWGAWDWPLLAGRLLAWMGLWVLPERTREACSGLSRRCGTPELFTSLSPCGGGIAPRVLCSG